MSDLEKNGIIENDTELNNENVVSEEIKDILKEEEEKEKADSEAMVEAEKDNIENSKEEHKRTSFGDLFIANFVDVLTISAISFIILSLFQIIIKFIGYKVSDMMSMYLIMFIIISLFYAPICHKSKLGTTIGNKLFYLSLKKDK